MYRLVVVWLHLLQTPRLFLLVPQVIVNFSLDGNCPKWTFVVVISAWKRVYFHLSGGVYALLLAHLPTIILNW